MHPILFEVPGVGFPIRSFGVMVAVGFVLGAWILNTLAARTSKDPEHDVPLFAQIPVWVVFGVLIGARLLYVAVEIGQGTPVGQRFVDDFIEVLFIWNGGLVMYGGFVGGLLGGIWCTRKYEIPTLKAMDLGLIAAFFGLAMGRIGCFLVGDDYGRVVPEGQENLPFPIVYRVPEVLPEQSLFGIENAGRVLYATQIWMSANALLLGLIGLVLLRRRRYPGQVFLILLVLYTITRGVIEHFRGDDIRGLWFDGALSTSQMISIPLGLLSIALLIKYRNREPAT